VSLEKVPSHARLGCNFLKYIGKTFLRSEGTPHHLRVSAIDHGPSYAVFLQNTLTLSNAVPRAMPWAGMRCPFRATGRMGFPMASSIRCLIDVARRSSVETGATVPGYSGGVAACAVVSYSDLL
jgi:hypothetical protein